MLRVRTLGGLSLCQDDEPVTGAGTQPRRLAVLALLARAGKRGVTREKMLALLWPDSDEESGRRALTQALYALRRDAGNDDLITGVQELRLNPDLVACDVTEFERALADRQYERAIGAYGGPFLDGFRVAGAGEFDRWMDEQRVALAHAFGEAVEHLARESSRKGEHGEAVRWWRRLAAIDPLNARTAAELMKSLVAAGDAAGAVQHARIHETLVSQDLDLPPDRDVVRLAEAIRRGEFAGEPRAGDPQAPVAVIAASGAGREESEPSASVAAPLPAEEAPAVVASAFARRTPAHRFGLVAAAAVGAVLILLAGAAAARRPPASELAAAGHLLAVGQIVDHREESVRGGGPLADMLATNLARVPELQVVSGVRMLELAAGVSAAVDPRDAALRAARDAGATEILEGALHPLPNGRLLLDLRRVELRSGTIRTAYRAEGTDVFSLVERATDDVARSFGRAAPMRLSPEQVTTPSMVAYRFYEEGLRAFARGDNRTARRLFAAALDEDSTFAMAAYYDWRSGGAAEPAVRLADRAPDRERLLIRGRWAVATGSPGMLAVAETLAIRYPSEIDGVLLLGEARLQRGEFEEAIAHFTRVVALDGAALAATVGQCRACEALTQLVGSYAALGRLADAERVARDWIARQPQSARPWLELAKVLFYTDRSDEAIEARRMAISLAPVDEYDEVFPAAVRLRAGDFATADRMLETMMRDGSRAAQHEARWARVISLRYQGRPEAAIGVLANRDARGRWSAGSTLDSVHIAQALLEGGRPAEARQVWEAIARRARGSSAASQHARSRAWYLGMAASAAALEGDTLALAHLADSIRAFARETVDFRVQQMVHHSRGLILLQRRDTLGAIREFRQAMRSPTGGYTRSNLELARILMANGRASEAVTPLVMALSGNLEGGNLYVTHTELRVALAGAWEAAGRADSAIAQYRWVARALAHAERTWEPKRAHAEARLAALGNGRRR